jgi:hypothetical protein
MVEQRHPGVAYRQPGELGGYAQWTMAASDQRLRSVVADVVRTSEHPTKMSAGPLPSSYVNHSDWLP